MGETKGNEVKAEVTRTCKNAKDLKVAADVINKLFEEASRNYKKPNTSAFPRTQAQTPVGTPDLRTSLPFSPSIF